MKFRIIYLSLIFFNTGWSQINISWKGDDLLSFDYKPDSLYSDWKKYNSSISLLQAEAFRNSFLEFSIDSVQTIDSLNFNVFVTKGPIYTWESITINNKGPKAPEYITDKWNSELVSASDLSNRFDKIITYFQNNGYPFTKVQLEEITSNENKISATLNTITGPKIVWDTLDIVGDLKLKKYFLSNYLGIKKGQPYDERLLKSISKKLNELPFVTLEKKPKIFFYKNKAFITLNLKDKTANFINGIIGVLPNSSSSLITGDESQLLITGDIKLNLGNALGYGEKLKFNWKRIQLETQQLNTEEDIPYLLKSPIGITHSLSLLKQDTSFISYSNKLGVKFEISPKRNLIAFWENQGTNTLNNKPIHSSNLSSTNGNSNSYGLIINWDQLDYRFNPRKGVLFRIEAKAGIKKILGSTENGKIRLQLSENENISTFIFVPESSMLYQGNITLQAYIPLWKTISMKLANNSGTKQNDYLLDNDLYRLGGFKLLRGFDQQSIFTSNYSVFTLEFRLLFEENSHLALFLDQSIIEKNTITDYTINYPLAFGGGINFQTRPGIFSVSYAIGKFEDTNFDFSAAKIHFGFVNLF